MRALVIIMIYAVALAFIWGGTQTAPQTGWPTTDIETTGCLALILGVIVKTIGHAVLVFGAPRARAA